jgi:hypothetical protein
MVDGDILGDIIAEVMAAVGDVDMVAGVVSTIFNAIHLRKVSLINLDLFVK